MKKGYIILIVGILIAILIHSCTNGDKTRHAPGYGNTSECTICGKAATHRSNNYGFCDKHWQDAIDG